MIIEFIKLQTRETTRSAVWNKNVIMNIILGLFILYLMGSFMFLGFFLDRILGSTFPDTDPVTTLNGVLLYYCALELLIRFFMQPTPALRITPFLHLPVKRSFLLQLLLARSIINPLNYISFLIFFPFAVRAVSVYYSGTAAIGWLLTLFLMMVVVIYINVFIKRQMTVRPVVSLMCGLAFVALIVLEIFGVFSMMAFSTSLFDTVLQQPLWILAPVTLTACVYLLNYRFLKACFYPEEIDHRNTKKQVAAQSLGFMSRFGLVGELISLELKLLFRHKRPKSMMYSTVFFLFLGLLFYHNPVYVKSMGWLIYVGIFITGMAMFTYGQFIVAWEGKYFDGILTRKNSLFDYFRTKYYVLVSFCIVYYLLTTPYVIFGMKFLWIQTACFLFNIGVNVYFILWFAQYNRKKIELTKGMSFNWQGLGASQYILFIPAIVLPILIVSIFQWTGLGSWGLVSLGFLGLLGILCHKEILRFIFRRFTQKKYELAEGFRNN